MPVAFGHLAADQLRQGASGNERRRSEDRHLLAVAAVGAAVADLVGRNPEIFGQFAPQARGVQRREGRKLRRADTRIDERHQPRDVGRVEDHNDVFHVGAVSLDVLAELCGDLGIALEQVFARHAGLAGRAARRNDIGRSRERLLDIARPGDVHPFERTVVKLLGHALERRSIGIVKADVGRKAHHQRRLGHVRADHAGRAHDRELVVCQKFHMRNIYIGTILYPGLACKKRATVPAVFRHMSCRNRGSAPQCAPAAGHSTSRRFSRACVMVSSSTYSSSSPKPMPRAMEVTFNSGNCRRRFIR